MCRAVLETEEGQSAAKGINDGIMYLMIFPYLLMAGVAYFIWRSRKKARSED
jgi:preprotein translocase subunit YajC